MLEWCIETSAETITKSTPSKTDPRIFLCNITDRGSLLVQINYWRCRGSVSFFFNGGPSFALHGDWTFGWVRGFLTSKSIGGASLTSFLHQVCIFTMKLELARYLQTSLRQIRSISTTGINNYIIFIVCWKNSTFIQQTVISVWQSFSVVSLTTILFLNISVRATSFISMEKWHFWS